MSNQPDTQAFEMSSAEIDGSEPKNFGELLRAALHSFRRLQGRALLSGLYWSAIAGTLSLLCFVNSHSAPIFVIAAIFLAIISILGGLLWSIALQQMAASDRTSETLTLAELFALAKIKFGVVVGIWLLIELLALVSFLLERVVGAPMLGVQLLLNIAAVVVGCRFFLARSIAIFEGRGVIDSLRRSWELTAAGGLGGWIKRFIAYTGTGALVMMVLVVIIVAVLIVGASQTSPSIFDISLLQGGFGRIVVCYVLATIIMIPLLAIGEVLTYEMYADQLLRNGEAAPSSSLGAPTNGDKTMASLA